MHTEQPPAPAVDAPAPGDADWIAHAPWDLRGNAVIVLFRGPSRGRGLLRRFSAMAFVDYADSNVGPYRELLILDRLLRRGGRVGGTVEKIWVDSQRSVDSGRANWGIPKYLAEFTHERGATERWSATLDGQPLAAVDLRPFGPPLPVLKPKRGAPLLQTWKGRAFATPISIAGVVRLAKIESIGSDPSHAIYPGSDAGQRKPVLALVVTTGRMRFHAADIDQLDRVAM